VLEIVDGLSFNTQAQRHELSELYETRIRRMGNAGRNGGEYYTPRPLIRAMIKVVDPKIGETIYDGAVGSAGFLCEAYDYLRTDTLSASEYETLQTNTFYGQEKKGLAYIIGIMNMVLHGIEAPNLVHSNTLNENVMDIQEKDRHDIILANPPFGGGERREVQQNFPIRTGETAYLFLQHFIRKLKAGGRAAVVIKNTFLSNTDNASVALRKELLETCNLHTILDCPQRHLPGRRRQDRGAVLREGRADRQTSGTTSSIQVAAWARPTRSTTTIWRSSSSCNAHPPNGTPKELDRGAAPIWTRTPSICRSRTPTRPRPRRCAAPRRSSPTCWRGMPRRRQILEDIRGML
jgi:type I restriction enzyme M protein